MPRLHRGRARSLPHGRVTILGWCSRDVSHPVPQPALIERGAVLKVEREAAEPPLAITALESVFVAAALPDGNLVTHGTRLEQLPLAGCRVPVHLDALVRQVMHGEG